MHDITASEFITTIFPQEEIPPEEVVVLAHPASFVSSKTGETVEYYKQMAATDRLLKRMPRTGEGWVYCVSTVARPESGGKVRRAAEFLRDAWAIVFDDIGTKAKTPPVEPSYILETSPGNFQWGYMLEPYNVRDHKGQAYFDACLIAAADAGFSDPGVRSAGRVVKVPGAVHKTGFITRCTLWEPDRVWPLKALMKELGLKPKARARGFKGMKPGKYQSLEDVDDPIYQWLVEKGLVDGHNDQFVHIECPWVDGHTDGARGSLTSTAYSPKDYGSAGRGFVCLHGSCQDAERGVDRFLEWVVKEGGPDLTGGAVIDTAAALSLITGVCNVFDNN
ncbi:MAG: hypothetical protein V3W44_08890 [Dehalococcoidales bacterium]